MQHSEHWPLGGWASGSWPARCCLRSFRGVGVPAAPSVSAVPVASSFPAVDLLSCFGRERDAGRASVGALAGGAQRRARNGVLVAGCCEPVPN